MFGRDVLVPLAVLICFGLTGCISGGGGGYSQTALAQQPSQEILDGTIRNPADWSDAPPRRIARRTGKVTIGAVRSGNDARLAASAEPPTVYSDEWWVKENRENERLKNRMQICRGC